MVSLEESKVNPKYPEVDGIEETIRLRRLLDLEQAEFQRELATLRTGLVSVKEVRNKEIAIYSSMAILFIILIWSSSYLIRNNYHTAGLLCLGMTVFYVVAVFAFHNDSVRKIILSSKEVQIEK